MTAPLSGIRVLDLSWVMVGPMTGRYLADLGAEVIKVESTKRVDPLRTLGPFKDATPGLDRSMAYRFINAGKRSLTLDLNSAGGREIVLGLAAKVDVVLETFTAGTLDRMGLGWKALSERNPRLIMAASCLFGQTGPQRASSGVGTLGAAYCGASLLVGWPDRRPTGLYNAWTDSVTPRYLVASILAALRRRDIENVGCFIDVSQAEAGLQFLAPAHLDYTVNHHVASRAGGLPDPSRAPCGVFPCAGNDRWIVIDASEPSAWQRLRPLASPHLDDIAFDTLLGRLRNRERLHAAVSQWTCHWDAQALEDSLQCQGIAAHRVCTGDDLCDDADLQADGYFSSLEDNVAGPFRMRNAQMRIHPAGTVQARPAPLLGDGTDMILRTVGGYTDEQIDSFRAAGALD